MNGRFPCISVFQIVFFFFFKTTFPNLPASYTHKTKICPMGYERKSCDFLDLLLKEKASLLSLPFPCYCLKCWGYNETSDTQWQQHSMDAAATRLKGPAFWITTQHGIPLSALSPITDWSKKKIAFILLKHLIVGMYPNLLQSKLQFEPISSQIQNHSYLQSSKC